MKAKVSALVLAGIIASPAFAGTPGTSYAGLQYAHLMYEDDLGLEAEPGALVGRIGHFVNEFVAIELRAGQGVSKGDLDADTTLELDYLYGVYGVGHIPIRGLFSIYGLLGYTGVEATARTGSASEDDNDSDFSFGAGVQVEFTRTISGSIEYISYFDESEFEITAVGAGVNFQF